MVPLDSTAMKIAFERTAKLQSGLLQKAYDTAIPDRKRQGIVLSVGERVDIKGGNFVVDSIGRKNVMLRGLPGTRIVKNSGKEDLETTLKKENDNEEMV